MTEVLRQQLQSIYEENGELYPKLVVETARDPEHPLHSRFEWRDSVAAESWRWEQAHRLIQSVRVVYREADETSEQKTVRAFHALPSGNGHGYVPLERIQSDPMMTAMLLADMEREWKALRRRYERFDEFVSMVRRDLSEAA